MSHECLTTDQLRAFTLGQLSGAEERSIAEHLEQCPACQERAAECDRAADSLVLALRSPRIEAEASQDEFYQQVANRVRDWSAGSPLPLDQTELTQLRDYRLLLKLGEGGMGTVYKALHTRLERVVALKVLPPERMRDQHAVARFQREMKAVGAMDHPALVRATDAGDIDGTHFLVMEYVDGLDLSALANRVGPLSIADACELVRQSAEGLRHVHERGMVHRDIKPSNLMLTPQGQVKILDLGLALLHADHGSLHDLTTVGQFMGTLDYMAPEQADDSHEVDPRADLYSLGATLYRLLCGVPPFGGAEFASPLKKFRALALLPVPSVRDRRPDIPVPLAEIIERLLAKEPSDRFPTAAEVAAALQPFTSGSDLARLYETASVGCDQRSAGTPQAASQPASPNGVPALRWSHPTPNPLRRGRWLGITLLLAAVFAAAGVIVVQTDRGELVIRSEAPDVQITISRINGEPVKDWELRQGTNRTTLRSGEYEIELRGQTDGLSVNGDTFTLTRGQQHVATIERRPRPASLDESTAASRNVDHPPSKQPTPTYGGKTFDDWAHVLKTDRQAERIGEAMVALATLAEGENAAKAVALILEEAAKHGNPIVGGSGDTADAEVRTAAVFALQHIEAPEGLAMLNERMRQAGTDERAHAVYALGRTPMRRVVDGNRVYGKTLSPEKARLAIPGLVAASKDENATVRIVALRTAADIDPQNELVRERLREALTDPVPYAAYTAAHQLTTINPQAEGLAAALQKIMQMDPAPPGQERAKGPPDITIIEHAVTAVDLARVAPETPGLLDELIRLTKSEGQGFDNRNTASTVRGIAMTGLAALGPRAKDALPVLLETAKGQAFGIHSPYLVPRSHSTTKELAIQALGAIGPTAATPEVIELLQQSSELPTNQGSPAKEIHDDAVEALRKIQATEEPTPAADSPPAAAASRLATDKDKR